MIASVSDFLHARSLWCTVQSLGMDGFSRGWQVSIKRREDVWKVKTQPGKRGRNQVHWKFKGKSIHLSGLDADTRLNQPCCARATRTPSLRSALASYFQRREERCAERPLLRGLPYEPLSPTKQCQCQMGKAELEKYCERPNFVWA